ncbi:hypothetical protein ACIQ7D_06175 [Streptomyces sp. NPDC096310]|uniref:hypothetical protein n=1 Tax=Streptomyces sp. NPDC096310 TaxID=3366082 RepID=UPI003802C23D
MDGHEMWWRRGRRPPCRFFLDEALRERGARYESGEPFAPHVVRDGNLVTGNPASRAEATALGSGGGVR